eukprot:CAMPEP_0170521862 /NCGR_PEP_ID=MMETSP0209-20121228/7273_1 /TAXON_ID=665100 ORGANISM="Litonotus pictus, Strain P1" /NCGR_SAMPLE_ID=MMETSP0209 /ASSEMBLY_ACC=CAM_ASM_000301 /LENGTH=334 /DNA_ID=CAMNT_0010808999 /DNA_START=645 /DNA_END=1646 /DNA_ORIENTATION=-
MISGGGKVSEEGSFGRLISKRRLEGIELDHTDNKLNGVYDESLNIGNDRTDRNLDDADQQVSGLSFDSTIPAFYSQKLGEVDIEEYQTVSYNKQFYKIEELMKDIQNTAYENSDIKTQWDLIFNSNLCNQIESIVNTELSTNIVENTITDINANSQSQTASEATGSDSTDIPISRRESCNNFENGILNKSLLQALELYNRNTQLLLELINNSYKNYKETLSSIPSSNQSGRQKKREEFIQEMFSYYNQHNYKVNEVLIDQFLDFGYSKFSELYIETIDKSIKQKKDISKIITILLLIVLCISYIVCYHCYFSSLRKRFEEVLTLLCILPRKTLK